MNNIEKINILNKVGMISNEDRTQSLTHGCNWFTFVTCVDLSIGVKVIPYGGINDKYSIEKYSQDLSSFMCWWNHFVMKDLNGFSGFSHVTFELVGFTLIP
jgi:hypothetical protein